VPQRGQPLDPLLIPRPQRRHRRGRTAHGHVPSLALPLTACLESALPVD
jgi:hypothetical protein